MKKIKGAVGVVIAVIMTLVVVAAVAVIAAAIYFGKGSGAGSGNSDAELSESETEAITEVQPVTEEIEYIDVKVSENDYLYQNKKYSLEDLIDELLKISPAIPVKITDDSASQKAYSRLTKALSENNIRIIESKQ